MLKEITSGRKIGFRSILILFIMSCLLCFSACQSGPSKPSANDPYADNAPKTKEEEEYYKDVYSGDWREQANPFGAGKSVCKKSGGTSMPPHWATIPHGAKTMAQIRSEADSRRMSQVNQQMAAQQLPQGTAQLAMNGSYPQNPNSAQYSSPNTLNNVRSANAPQNSQTVPFAAPAPYSAPVSAGQMPVSATPNGSAPAPYSAPVSAGQMPISATPNGSASAPYSAPVSAGQIPISAAPNRSASAPYSAPVSASQMPISATPNGSAPAPYSAPVSASQMPVSATPNRSAPAPYSAPVSASQMPVSATPNRSASAPYSAPVSASQMPINSPQNNSGTVPANNANRVPFPVNSYTPVSNGSNGINNNNTRTEFSSDLTPEILTAEQERSEIIIRGQAPLEDPPLDLRQRMRNAYFTEEPVKIAQTGGSARADLILDGENDQNKTASTQTAPVNWGTPRTLNVNPKIADSMKTVPEDNAIPHRTGSNRLQKENRSYEYIFDGGDSKGEFYSTPDWHHYNLDAEDTITQFDTVDGQILSEPSNRVQIYSPRFGSVRQVLGPAQKTEIGSVAKTETDTPPIITEEIAATDIRSQEEKTGFTRTDRTASSASAKNHGDTISAELAPVENNQSEWIGKLDSILVSDEIKESDRAAITTGTTAAEAWGSIQQVEVDIDSVRAQVNIYNKSAEALVTVENGTKSSKLRLIKVANKQSAKPGELVEFTLRFENIGDTTVGNVTVMDNLAARLEYIPDTAQSSRKGEFLVRSNSVGSQTLRWEISDPLPKGEFGVIKFICKVR